MATKITEMNEQELVARIVADEDRLRKWHRPRLVHLEETRLVLNFDVNASVLPDDPLVGKLKAIMLSTRPREFWNWARGVLADQPLRYQNPYSSEARRWGQKEKGSAIVEYLAYGIAAQEDAVSVGRGQGEPSRFDLAAQMLSGSYAFYPQAEELGGGDIAFRRDFYEPAQVFWLPGRMGMQIVLRSYLAPLLEVRLHLDENKKDGAYLTGKDTDMVQCIDYYVMDGGKPYNAFVTMGGIEDKDRGQARQLAMPLRHLDKYDSIPLICGCVNIMDIAPSKAGTQNAAPTPPGENVWERWGQSVLASVIRAVRQANVWETLAHLSARKALYPTEVRATEGGEAPDERPVEPGEQRKVVVRAGSEEDLRYVAQPSSALDVSRQADRFDKELDIATISPSLMGQTEPQVASGFLREGWEQATRTAKLGVYDQAMKAVEKQSKMQSIRQFRKMSGKTHLWGQHPLERHGLDGHFEGDFTPDQVPKGFWALEINRAPARPVDMAAIGNEARARQLAGTISMRRSREMQGIEDPDGEKELIDQENREKLPLRVAMKHVEATGRELEIMRDRVAELRAQPGAAEPGEDVDRLEGQADLLEAVYVKEDMELGAMTGTMAPAAQGQLGREAPQPNASLMAPMPGPGVQPPEMRNEGKMQKQAAMMGGAGGP